MRSTWEPRQTEIYQMHILNPLSIKGLCRSGLGFFFHVNLAKTELHFPEFPSLYNSRLGLVKREMCEIWKAEVKQKTILCSADYCRVGHIHRLTVYAWPSGLACSSPAPAGLPPAASLNPLLGARSTQWSEATPYPAGHSYHRS